MVGRKETVVKQLPGAAELCPPALRGGLGGRAQAGRPRSASVGTAPSQTAPRQFVIFFTKK